MAVGGQMVPLYPTPQSIDEDLYISIDEPPGQKRTDRKMVTELEILASCTWCGLSGPHRTGLLPLSQDGPSEAASHL